MNIKFNWGTGIFTFIGLFIISMISIIIFSFNQKVNLVTPEYYPKGVKYEDHIIKVKNTSLLKGKVYYERDNNKITLNFPEEFSDKKISGTVQFYYIADFEKDYTSELKLNKNRKQEISTGLFAAGRYILKIDWKDGEKAYYQEIDLNL
ncbi:MAG: FixH family protein [Bacteroidota bacterium]